MRKCLKNIYLVGVILAASACGPQGKTGAMEPGELYNTMGLEKDGLFDGAGLAPMAYSDAPFVRVGLMWETPGETVLEGRVVDEQGMWTRWRPIEPRWSEGTARTGHLDPDGGVAAGFQLRVSDGPVPTHLFAEAIGFVGEPRGAPGPDGIQSLTQRLAPASLVHPRADWGARAPACGSASHNPAAITVHHTATPLPDSISATARVRQIQNYHIDTRGYCDIGYHFLVDWNGDIWQGRDEDVRAAHVLNNNTNNVGISFMGTYNTSVPSAAQMTHTANLMGWLRDTYGIPLDRAHVKGHREYRGNTPGDCPGDQIQARLGDLLTGGGVVTDGVLQGTVFEDKGQGLGDMSVKLPGATVSVAGGGSVTARDGDAYWSLSLPAGTYTLTASAPGHLDASRTCAVAAGGEVWCSIGLAVACVPDCSQRVCGADPVCGVSCGTCPADHACESGACACQPDCRAQVCGTDPICEASCGVCSAGEVCTPEGACEVPREDGPDLDPDPDPGDPDEEETIVRGGCATGPSGGRTTGWILVLVVPLARRRFV